ncbi:g7698 [Coccomyxa viridis]|uniref:G7698 protein n=1 Tax=Coccomyxa viridis TaxID=1274662 RepID=A0ABP1G134_9CHLO
MCFDSISDFLKGCFTRKQNEDSRLLRSRRKWNHSWRCPSWLTFPIVSFARAAGSHEHLQAHPFEPGDDHARAFGTTRSDPEVLAAVREANRCQMLIQSKVVRQNPQRLQALEAERNAHDRRLMHAIYEDVLGGEALMRALEQCKEVLMIPNTSYENLGSYVWRPESEVDLSSLAPSMNQSERNQLAGRISSAGQYQDQSNEEFETAPLLPESSPSSVDLRHRF